MKCVKAEKIRIYQSAPADGRSISFYEAKCSGTYIDVAQSVIHNIFQSATVEAGDSASAVYSDSSNTYGYDKLIDGSVNSSSGRFSSLSNKKDASMDAILTLDAKYSLTELRLYDFTNVAYEDAQNAGRNLEISVLCDGIWTTVYSYTTAEQIAAHRKSADSTGLQYLSFEFDSVTADAIRIVAKNPVIKNNKYISISMYELQCSGALFVEKEELVYEDNILSAKPVVPGEKATETVSGYGYNKLTDGSYDNKAGRFSTKTNNSAIFDATISLGANYKLSEVKLYFYDGKIEYAGNDLTVSVYSNGKWYTAAKYEYGKELLCGSITVGGTTPGKSYITFELGGINAEQIRVYASSPVSGKSITFYEITCKGAKTAEAVDRTELLDAIRSLPTESATDGLLYDFITDESYAKFKEYAENYAATQEMVDAYTAEIIEYRNMIANGSYTVKWYDKDGNLIKADTDLAMGSTLTAPDGVDMSIKNDWYSASFAWTSGKGGAEIDIAKTTVFKNVSYYLGATDIEQNLTALRQNLTLFGYVQMNLCVPEDLPVEITTISVLGDEIFENGRLSFDGENYYTIYSKPTSASNIASDSAVYTVYYTVTVGGMSERLEAHFTLSPYSYLEKILASNTYADAHTLAADMLRYSQQLGIAAKLDESIYADVSALLEEHYDKCSELPTIGEATTDIGNLAEYVKAVCLRIDTFEPNFKLMVDERVTKITLTAEKYNGKLPIESIYGQTVYNTVYYGSEIDNNTSYSVYLSEGLPIHTIGFDYRIDVYIGDEVVASGSYNILSNYYNSLDATLYADYRNFVRAMYAYSESAIDYRFD